MQVRWNNSLSPLFSVTNGVRQGGVLSPILFTVYLDNLLSSLKSLGIGCHWDRLFVGAVSYADNIALLAASPSALGHSMSNQPTLSFSILWCMASELEPDEIWKILTYLLLLNQS